MCVCVCVCVRVCVCVYHKVHSVTFGFMHSPNILTIAGCMKPRVTVYTMLYIYIYI